MNEWPKPKQRIITPLRLLFSVAVVVTAAAVILPEFARTHDHAPRISCVNNQKQLGTAFRGFGIDIGGFPMLLSNTNSTTNAPELVDASSSDIKEHSAQ